MKFGVPRPRARLRVVAPSRPFGLRAAQSGQSTRRARSRRTQLPASRSLRATLGRAVDASLRAIDNTPTKRRTILQRADGNRAHAILLTDVTARHRAERPWLQTLSSSLVRGTQRSRLCIREQGPRHVVMLLCAIVACSQCRWRRRSAAAGPWPCSTTLVRQWASPTRSAPSRRAWWLSPILSKRWIRCNEVLGRANRGTRAHLR